MRKLLVFLLLPLMCMGFVSEKDAVDPLGASVWIEGTASDEFVLDRDDPSGGGSLKYDRNNTRFELDHTFRWYEDGNWFVDRRVPTYIIAAVDSANTLKADYRCDGTADESEIQTAANAIDTSGVGGTILLLEGTYHLADEVFLHSNTRLVGSGPYTIIECDGSKNTGLTNYDRPTGGQGDSGGNTRIEVAHLSVDGNGTTNDPIEFELADHVWIHNTLCYDGDDDGIELEDCEYALISNNICHSSDINGIELDDGCSYCIVQDNISYGNKPSGYGIEIDGDSSHNLVTGNICYDNQYGIQITANAGNNEICGNLLRGNSGAPINNQRTTADNVILEDWDSQRVLYSSVPISIGSATDNNSELQVKAVNGIGSDSVVAIFQARADASSSILQFWNTSAGEGEIEFDHNTDQLTIEVGSSSPAVTTFTSDGRIGVNVSPDSSAELHVKDKTAGTDSVIARLEAASDTSSSIVEFADTSGLAGQIEYDHSGDVMNFSTTAATALQIGNGGEIFIPYVYSDDLNGETYRDMLIKNDGQLGYDSSTIRKKTDVVAIQNVEWIYELRPITFRFKKKVNGAYIDEATGHKRYGLIAEEVEKVNDVFVFYDEVGRPEGVHYRELIAPLIKAVQMQKAEIDALKAQIRGVE